MTYEEKIQELKEELLDLNEQVQQIQAAADAEKRELNEDENTRIEAVFTRFKEVEDEIDRRKRIHDQTQRLAESFAPRTDPNPISTPPTRAENAYTIPGGRQDVRIVSAEDSRKWGWRNGGEFLQAVANAARGNVSADPRLFANAASTFSSGTVGEEGAFAIPPAFSEAIREVIQSPEGGFLPLTDEVETSGNMVDFPTDETTDWQTSGGVQVYWPDEGVDITQSKVQLKSVMQKLNKVAALVPVTDELLSDAVALNSYLRRRVPRKINFSLWDKGINGTGAGTMLGILNSPALISVPKVTSSPAQSADTIVYQNITAMWSRLPGASRSTATWLVHESDVEQQFYEMEFDFQNANKLFPVYLPPGGASQTPFATLFGRPIIPTQACQALGDKGDIILADLQQYMTVTKQGEGIQDEMSIHVYFEAAQTAFRFLLRVTGRPWLSAPIQPLRGSATMSPFITLDERA